MAFVGQNIFVCPCTFLLKTATLIKRYTRSHPRLPAASRGSAFAGGDAGDDRFKLAEVDRLDQVFGEEKRRRTAFEGSSSIAETAQGDAADGAALAEAGDMEFQAAAVEEADVADDEVECGLAGQLQGFGHAMGDVDK